MSASRLIAVVREFTNTILNPYDLEEFLHRLTGHAVALTRADAAGIMLAGRGDGVLGFAAASGERAVQMEALQDHLASSACNDAFSANQLRVVEDLDGDGRWPEYERCAVQLGLRAVLAVPMNASGQTIGVVNIYRDAPGPWSADDREAAQIITAMGAGYVLHANQLKAQHDLADQLRIALERGDLLGQAKGILMSRHGIDAEAALGRLRRRSQRTAVTLREVACDVVSAAAADGN